jgi:hypothetical protein
MQSESIHGPYQSAAAAAGLVLLLFGEAYTGEVSISILGSGLIIWALLPGSGGVANLEPGRIVLSELFAEEQRTGSRIATPTMLFFLAIGGYLSTVLIPSWLVGGRFSLLMTTYLVWASFLLLLKLALPGSSRSRQTDETDHPVQAGKTPLIRRRYG